MQFCYCVGRIPPLRIPVRKNFSCDDISVKLRHTDISIPAAGAWLEGHLAYAPNVRALVAILEPDAGNASGRYEEKFVYALQQKGFATLTMDLLTPHEEEHDRDAYYNIPQMTGRVIAIAEWISHQPSMTALPLGLIGMHTACAAAVRAASRAPGYFGAIVCCGGRPDLAGAGPLAELTCPTRIIVGSLDPDRDIIRQAYMHIRATRDWQLVEGADAVFSQPDAAARFVELAGGWLQRMLPPALPENDAPNAPLPGGDTL